MGEKSAKSNKIKNNTKNVVQNLKKRKNLTKIKKTAKKLKKKH